MNDLTAVENCDVIYRPKGRADEYAVLATNPYSTCTHGCVYCFAPSTLHVLRDSFYAADNARADFIRKLILDAAKYQKADITEQVLMSFVGDVYHRSDTLLTRQTIEVLQAHGLGICTLTKGGTRALRDIDLFRPERDAFASTLTFLDNESSLRWEPNAAPPADRIAALRAFFGAGIYTFVSLEPVLDVEAALRIIEETHSFVNLFKIGKLNYHAHAKTIDWRRFTERVIELCARLNVAHYVKKDLQKYLPEGYPNPLRRAQFHAGPCERCGGVKSSPVHSALCDSCTPITPVTEAVIEVVSAAPERKRSPKTTLARKAASEMSDAELGAALKGPTERITKHVGSAVAHEQQAKTARLEAQREFNENIDYYFDAKKRMSNPGYRADLASGKNRTADDNLKNFGAPDWQTFIEQCGGFSLRHADRLLAKFTKANDEVADGGDNSNPPDDIKPPQPKGRQAEDLTALKRYEHVATAAMEIANRNPEGKVEKQLLAAAEFIPAPLTPLPPDLYTEVLNFITAISTSTTDRNLKAEAKRLLGKMRLHQPKADPEQVQAEAQATTEKKRKRNKRIAERNGGALGSEGYNPPTSATSGHVQGFAEPMSDAEEEITPAFSNPAAQASSFVQLPLKPGKKYKVRPAPSGGYGVYEGGSPVILQRHPTSEAAWDAIDAVTAIPESVVT